MFGMMQHLNVVLCATADDAIAQGYHKDGKYKDSKAVAIDKVVIVREGTQGGNPSVDLVLKDEAGNQYVVMVTGRLLKSLPL
jgi:hypothetical protein